MNDLQLKNLREYSGFVSTPEGWIDTTVGDICDLGRGRVISQEEINYNPGPYPVFSSQTRNNGQMGSIATFDLSGQYVTWTTDGENAGTVFFRSGQFNCTNVCGTLVPKKSSEIDLRFLTYHLGRVAKRYVSYIGNPKLMNGVMASVGLILPPAKVQCRIAEILAALDEAIEKTQSLITKYQQIKAGLMHDLFTRGVTANGKLRPPREKAPELYKETPIGWIPKEWDVVVMDQLCNIIDPQPDHRTPPEQEDGIPYIGIGDFDAFGDVDTSSCRRIVVSTYLRQKGRFSVEMGDIIYGKIGTIGHPKKLPGSIFALSANVLLMKPCINKQYFLHALMTKYFEKQISDVTNTTSQPALGIEKVRKLKLPCPSSTEQILIAQYLDQTDLKLSKEFSVAQKFKKQKSGLMHDLLTGCVRI